MHSRPSWIRDKACPYPSAYFNWGGWCSRRLVLGGVQHVFMEEWKESKHDCNRPSRKREQDGETKKNETSRLNKDQECVDQSTWMWRKKNNIQQMLTCMMRKEENASHIGAWIEHRSGGFGDIIQALFSTQMKMNIFGNLIFFFLFSMCMCFYCGGCKCSFVVAQWRKNADFHEMIDLLPRMKYIISFNCGWKKNGGVQDEHDLAL